MKSIPNSSTTGVFVAFEYGSIFMTEKIEWLYLNKYTNESY